MTFEYIRPQGQFYGDTDSFVASVYFGINSFS